MLDESFLLDCLLDCVVVVVVVVVIVIVVVPVPVAACCTPKNGSAIVNTCSERERESDVSEQVGRESSESSEQ
jgi:hypothetical protein